MRKAFLTCLAALLAAVLLCPALTFAEKEHRVVRVGYYDLENYMIGPSEEAAKSGYTYDLLSEIAAYNNWEYQFVYGSFGDLLQKLERGDIDILPNVIRTDERAQKMLFSDDPIADEFYFVSALTDSENANVTDSADLNGKRLATVSDAFQNVVFARWAEARGIGMEIISSETFEGSWELVRSGQADFVLNIDNTAPDSGFTTLFEVGKMSAYFAAAQDRQDILDEFNGAMNSIKKISPFLISHLEEKYLAGTLSSYKLSKAEQEWIAEHPVLKVGGLSDDRPYAYRDENGDIVGVYPEVVKMIVDRLELNVQVEWTLMDSVMALHDALKDGVIDLMCPQYYSYYDAAQEDVHITEKVIDAPMGMLYLNSASRSDGYVAVTGSRPGLNFIREVMPEAEVRVYDNMNDCLNALFSGEVVCTVAHTYALTDYINSYREDLNFTTMSAKCGICFAARTGDHELIEIINRGRHLIYDNEINYLEIQHVTAQKMEYTIQQFLRDNLPLFILGVLVVVLLAALVVYRTVLSGRMKRSLIEITRQKEVIERNEIRLAAAEEAASAASRAKSTFLFNMSHDIRTPMNAIIGFTNSARKNMDDRGKLTDCLDKVERSSRHLLGLINDVLDMARIESGKVTINESVMTVEPLFDDIIALLSESYAEKELTFESEKTLTHAYIMADRLNLNRVLMNIVSNAVKYTPAGGHIFCAIRETGCNEAGRTAFEFITRDNGIGMSREFVRTIFDAFTRETSAAVSGMQGTGLGMAITKQLVERMGGTIEVQSEPGRGSEFTVKLSFEIADDEAVREYEENQKPVSHPALSFKGKRLLLVEDNELNREIARELLEESGFLVEDAEDGAIAVRKVTEAQPGRFDAVLMDIQMPNMDGYEAARAIRALSDENRAAVPIIAMTANAFEEDRRNALAAGMNDHIAKPIDVNKLMRALSDILQNRQS